MARIKFDGVSKRWGSFVGVETLDLEVGDREFLVLLGPSGCGKTTTMRMVAGLDEPTGGRVWIGERDVTRLSPKDRDIAMVFQSYGLYAHLSVYENIRFPLQARGVPKAQHDAKVRRAADMVELTAFLDRKPKALSGGQRQRVALARAIVREPNCYLMDEPLSNLDAKLRVSMRAEIKHLQHTLNVTTIYVTHDQVEAMTLAHRVAVMDRGRIRQLATPAEVYNDPADLFVAGFIGSPAMNLVEGSLVEGTFRAEGVEVPLPDFPGTREGVVLGVRAEDLTVVAPEEGHFRRPIYSIELLGDATLVTQRHGKGLVTAKADKAFAGDIERPIGFRAAGVAYHLFERDSGRRIRPGEHR